MAFLVSPCELLHIIVSGPSSYTVNRKINQKMSSRRLLVIAIIMLSLWLFLQDNIYTVIMLMFGVDAGDAMS